jgi:hypothetical protein
MDRRLRKKNASQAFRKFRSFQDDTVPDVASQEIRVVTSTVGPQPERIVRSAPDIPEPVPDRAVFAVADSVCDGLRAEREADSTSLALYESGIARQHSRRRINSPAILREEPAPADAVTILATSTCRLAWCSRSIWRKVSAARSSRFKGRLSGLQTSAQWP